MASQQPPCTLWARNVNYSVKDRHILREVDFVAKPGQLTAIVGPSGCGKTTLLNALLFRLKGGKLTGEFGVNELTSTETIVKRLAHYVMALDVALPYLTVQETIRFAAVLRLPQVSKKGQQAAADELIKALRLETCKDTLIGGPFRKGISKGQLKRVAIAVELLGNPPILCLDEPTSGLDSALALELVMLLKDLARNSSRTIVCSIHQPSQRAFRTFDRVCALRDGMVICQGKVTDIVPYFSQTFGRECPLGHSEADFLLELATYGGLAKEQVDEEEASLKGNGPANNLIDQLVAEFPKSQLHEQVVKSIESARRGQIDEDEFGPADEEGGLKPAQVKKLDLSDPIFTADAMLSRGAQFRVIWKRSTINTLRSPLSTIIIILINLIQALALGALFWRLDGDMDTVRHGSINDWPIWDSSFVQYFTKGLDKSGERPLHEPFRTLLSSGVDNAGSSLVFDLMNTPGLAGYGMDVFQCVRELYSSKTVINDAAYPRWYYQPGVIDGSAPEGSEGNTHWPGAPTDYSTAPIYVESVVNAIIGGMQILDLVTKLTPTWNFTTFESGWDSIGFQTPANLVSPLVNPLFCCLGLGTPMNMMGGKSCTVTFPGISLPQFPPMAAEQILQLSQSVTKEDLVPAVAEIMNAIRGFGRSSARNGQALAGHDRLEIWSEGPALSSGAPRRILGSGLGGMATDIWNLLANDPSSPQYEFITELRNIYGRISECSNSYCTAVVRSGSSLAGYATDVATTTLSALNFAGAIFFIVANLGFATYDVLLQFPTDRAVFNRERADNLYKSSAFFLGKTIAELPFQLIPSLLWTTIIYFMVGFERGPGRYGLFLVVSWLVSFAAYGFGYFISAISPRVEVAIILSPLLLIIMLLVSGFFLREFPVWLGWTRFFSIYRFGFFAMCAAQFRPSGSFGSLDNNLLLVLVGAVETSVGKNCLWLFLLALGYRLLSYLCLVGMYRHVGLEA